MTNYNFGFVEVKKKKERAARMKLWANSVQIELPPHFYSISVFKWNEHRADYLQIPFKPAYPQLTLSETTLLDYNTAIESMMREKKFERNEFFFKPEWSPNGLFVSRKISTKTAVTGQFQVRIFTTPGYIGTVLNRICLNFVKEYVDPCWEHHNYKRYSPPMGQEVWVTDVPVHSPAFLVADEAISARCRLEDETIYLEIVVYPHEIGCEPRTLSAFIHDLAVFHNYEYTHLNEVIDQEKGKKSITKTHIREALLGLHLSSPDFTITEVSTDSWVEGWENANVVFPACNIVPLDNRKTSSIIRRCRLTEGDQRKSIERHLSTLSRFIKSKGWPFQISENRIFDGKLLQLPELEFAQNIREPSINGQWIVHPFYEGAKIEKWFVMFTSNVQEKSLNSLIDPLVETARKQGMILPEPIFSKIPLIESDYEDLINYQLLDSQQQREYDFVLLLCNSESSIPDKLRAFAKKHRIFFMVMRMGNIFEKPILAVQKMNTVNGGVCARVCDTTERYSANDLHIGISYATIDENHVAGLCAISWRLLVERGFYKNINDFSVFLQECNRICREKYKEKHGEEPDRVYYYFCRVRIPIIMKAFENRTDWDKHTRVTVISVRPEYNLKLFPNPSHQNRPKSNQFPKESKTAVGTVVKIRDGVFLLCSYAPYFDTPQIYRYTIIINGTCETETQLQSLTLKLCHQHLVNMSKKMPYIAFFANTKVINEKKRYRSAQQSRRQSLVTNFEEYDPDTIQWAAYDQHSNEEDTVDFEVYK